VLRTSADTFVARPISLALKDIRKYQAMLFTKLKFQSEHRNPSAGVASFLLHHVLKRNWSIAEAPYPKKVRHLPQVLSQEEVARLIDAADTPSIASF